MTDEIIDSLQMIEIGIWNQFALFHSAELNHTLL